jgi:DMSO reductase anchor subunit
VLVVALLLAVAGEIVGRYLFFVSVVPKHLAAPYIASASEAV